MPDPQNLNSPPASVDAGGIMTAEEVWNEIGWPTDNPNSQSHTPIEAIEATIQRVVRGYEDQAIAEIEQSQNAERFLRESVETTLSVSQGAGSLSEVGVAEVPGAMLPYFFGQVIADDGTPMDAADDVPKLAHTSLTAFQDYRYQRSGREVLVLPKSLSTITAWLVPQVLAVETALRGIVPEINQQILQAAAEALERRTAESQRIEQESLSETP